MTLKRSSLSTHILGDFLVLLVAAESSYNDLKNDLINISRGSRQHPLRALAADRSEL
jgi:hypothetical protein